MEGRQRIDYAEAEKMLRGGATQQQVAERFGVTQAAVHGAIRRGRIKGITYDRSNSETSGVPWHPIKPEHRDRYLVRMLRAAARRERGEKSTAVIEAHLDKFLEAFEQADWVVDYDPVSGFSRVSRRDGIDLGFVRDPWKDDEGRPVIAPPNVWPR